VLGTCKGYSWDQGKDLTVIGSNMLEIPPFEIAGLFQGTLKNFWFK
jgi:hypothetical protein